MRRVFGQLARVLRPSGSVWLNLGDTYSRHHRTGAAPKSMVLAPERLLIALADDGWIVRNKVIWAKTNPMPTSVRDRLAGTYDVIYFLVRSSDYYFDLDAIREPHRLTSAKRRHTSKPWPGSLGGKHDGLSKLHLKGQPGHWLGKNPGDVWRHAVAHFRGAHFATFPTDVITRPILATCPEHVCTACGKPWQRKRISKRSQPSKGTGHDGPTDRHVQTFRRRWRTLHKRGPLISCDCGAPTQPGIVLDPFFGTGTIAEVAEDHHRDWLGIEISPDYRQLAQQRIRQARQRRKETHDTATCPHPRCQNNFASAA